MTEYRFLQVRQALSYFKCVSGSTGIIYFLRRSLIAVLGVRNLKNSPRSKIIAQLGKNARFLTKIQDYAAQSIKTLSSGYKNFYSSSNENIDNT